MSLEPGIKLAGRALFALLDPVFGVMPAGGYEAANDLGRWKIAFLRVEDAIGLAVPPELEAGVIGDLRSPYR